MTARAALLCLLAAGCAVEPDLARETTPVIGGDPVAPGEYPATVALVLDTFGGWSFFCSGTLISDTVVLTAAHCLDPSRPVPAVTFVTDANEVGAADVLAGKAMYPHPGFDISDVPGAGLARFDDVGIVVLAEPVVGVAPEIVASPELAAELLIPGTTIELVGYGLSDEKTQQAGVKLKGTASLRELNEWELYLSEPGEQQNCFGDSGGPGFARTAEGERRLVGVVSRGPDPSVAGCMIGGIDTRADAYLGWIDEVLSGQDAGPVAGEPDAAAVAGPDAGDAAADGDEAGGCCAVAGRRRTSPGSAAIGLAALALVAVVRMRRRQAG